MAVYWATHVNYTCKSFIELTPGVKGVIYETNANKNFLKKKSLHLIKLVRK